MALGLAKFVVINLMLMAFAVGALAYRLAGLVYRFEIWTGSKSMILSSALILIYGRLFLIRKNQFSVPGIDYK